MTHLWTLEPDSTGLCIDFVSGNGLPWVIYSEIWEDPVIKPFHEKRKKKGKAAFEDQFWKTDAYWSSRLSVAVARVSFSD